MAVDTAVDTVDTQAVMAVVKLLKLLRYIRNSFQVKFLDMLQFR